MTAVQVGATKLAIDLWVDSVNHGGGTRSVLDSTTPPFGYVVGRPPYGDILPPELPKFEKVEYIDKWVRSLPSDVRYVGIWCDGETALIHLDAVDVYANKHTAHAATIRRGEMAYYSLHEGKEYRPEGGH